MREDKVTEGYRDLNGNGQMYPYKGPGRCEIVSRIGPRQRREGEQDG